MRKVIVSIRHNDYNSLPPLVSTPFDFLAGKKRLASILSRVHVYAFATAITFLVVLKKVLDQAN
jgi:hypothetical protein